MSARRPVRAGVALALVLGVLAAPTLPAASAAADDPPPAGPSVTLDDAASSPDGAFVALTTRTPPTTASGPVTFAAVTAGAPDPDDDPVCEASPDGTEVVLHRAGTCTVTATVDGAGDAADATDTRDYPVALAPRTLVIAAPTDPLVATGTWTPEVTFPTGALEDGESVTLSTDDDEVCEPGTTPGTITLHRALPCLVTASVDDGDVYAAADDDRSVTPSLATRTVTLVPPSSTVSGVPWLPQVTGPGSGATSFETEGDGCDLSDDGTTIDLLAAGETCRARAQVGADETYDTATSGWVELEVDPRPVDVDIQVSTPRRYRGTFTVTVTATDPDPTTAPGTSLAGSGEIRVGDDDPEDVDLVDGVATLTVSGPRPGAVDVEVSLTPDPATSYGEVVRSSTVTVDPGEQSVAFTTPPAAAWVGDTWSPAARLTPATEPDGTPRVAVVVSDDTDVCTVDDTATVTFVGPGDCPLRASHPGVPDYDAAIEVTTEVEVSLRPVRILYSVSPEPVPGTSPVHGETFTVTARAVDGVDGTTPVAGTGTLTVTDAPTPAPPGGRAADATPDGWTDEVEVVGVGGRTHTASVTFAATDARYASYTGADTTTVRVERARQSLAWADGADAPPAEELAGESWTPVLVRGETDADVVLDTVDDDVCDVDPSDDTTIVFLAQGECEVTATQAGDEHYLDTTIDTPVDVLLRPVTVTLTPSEADPVFGDTVTYDATVVDDHDPSRLLDGTGVLTAPGLPGSGQALTYVDGVATGVDLGPLPVVTGRTVTATFVPDDADVHAGGSGTAGLTVRRAPQVIVPPADLDTDVAVGEEVEVLARGGESGNVVTGHVANGAPCSVANPTVVGRPVLVTFNRPVSCTVELRQAGNDDYAAADPVEVTFTVSRRAVRVLVSTDPAPFYYDDLVAVTVRVVDDGPGGGPTRPAPGTVTVAVPGVTGVVTTTQPVQGSTTVTYRVPVAGAQRLDVTFAPTDADRFAPITATDDASRQEVVSLARPQAVVFDDAAIPSPAWASRTWAVPLSGTPGGGGFTLVARAVAGATHCTVSGLVVRFSSEGDCVLDAYQDAVAGRFERSPARRIVVDVDAIGYQVQLRQPDSGEAGVPLVVRAFARDVPFRAAVAGSGSVTLQRRSGGPGSPFVDVPGATTSGTWVAGGLDLVVAPTLSGTYRVVADFEPTDSPAYRFDGTTGPFPSADFEVLPGTQVVSAPGAPTSAAVLDRWTVTARGGGSPNPVVASLAEGTTAGACALSGPARAQVLEFTGPGWCYVDLVQAGDASYGPGRLPQPLEIKVSQAVPVVEVVGQTVAQPVVGEEHRITVRATSSTSGRPLPGRFVLTTDRGERRSVPSGVLDATSAVDTATVGFVPQTSGALLVDVDFEPLDTIGVLPRSIDVPLDVLPGTQRLSVATAPASDDSHVGDAWNPVAEVVHGPPGAQASVTVATTLVDGVPQPPRCRWNAATQRVDLVAAGTCRVTVSAPAVGVHWAAPVPVTRSFEVSVNQTSLAATVVIPAGRSQAWVDDPFEIRVEASGVDGAENVAIDATVRLTFTGDGRQWTEVVTVDDTVTTVPVTIGNAAAYRIEAVLVPDDAARWATTSIEEAQDVDVVRQPHTLRAPAVPARLPALTTWTSPARSSAGIVADVAVAEESAAVCRVVGLEVEMTAPGSCRLDFSVPDGNRVYDDVAPVRAIIPVVANATRVDLVPPATGRVGVRQAITARVRALLPTPAPETGAALTPGEHLVRGEAVFTATAPGPGGTTVTTEVDRVAVTVVAGTATSPATDVTGAWTPPGATDGVRRTLGVRFEVPPVPPVPTDPSPWLGSTATSVVLSVDKGQADLDLHVERRPEAGTDGIRIVAELAFGGDVPASVVGGEVTFRTSGVKFDATATVRLVGEGADARTVASVDTVDVPAGAKVTVHASYSGNQDLGGATGSVERGVPEVDRLTDAPSGWQRGPVTFEYECFPAADLVADCPKKVTVTGDGAARRESFQVVAVDGGTRFVDTPVVAIDATPPRVAVQGIADGSTFDGLAPGPRCQASDATSGLKSCTLATRRIDRLRRQVTATATDVAGNVSTVTVRYRELQEWVVGAPRDAADRFAVRPGARIRVETITQGARRKPQLVAMRGGRWTPVATMVAWRQRDGAYTWYVLHRLPAGWRPSARLGVRVGSSVRPLGLVRR